MSNNDNLKPLEPHCPKCGARMGSPYAVGEDCETLEWLDIRCLGREKHNFRSDYKKWTLTDFAQFSAPSPATPTESGNDLSFPANTIMDGAANGNNLADVRFVPPSPATEGQTPINWQDLYQAPPQLLAAVKHFIATRGRHDGEHIYPTCALGHPGNGVGCSRCEQSYIEAETELDEAVANAVGVTAEHLSSEGEKHGDGRIQVTEGVAQESGNQQGSEEEGHVSSLRQERRNQGPQASRLADDKGVPLVQVRDAAAPPQPVATGQPPQLAELLKDFVANYARLNGVREQIATPKYDRYVEGASDFADEIERQLAVPAPGVALPPEQLPTNYEEGWQISVLNESRSRAFLKCMFAECKSEAVFGGMYCFSHSKAATPEITPKGALQKWRANQKAANPTEGEKP